MASIHSRQIEWPTVVVALGIYAGWLLVISYHESIGGFFSILFLALLIAWHGALQHEIIHGHPFRSEPANELLATVPINPFRPYRVYRRSHLRHHICTELTDPDTDTESFFVKADTWTKLNILTKSLLIFHQTLFGRIILGPLVQIFLTIRHDISEIRSGDGRLLRWWLIHLVLVGLLFLGITELGSFPFWQYLVATYCGASLTSVRTYCEHRWVKDEATRSATVTSKGFWALLFLNNNLHDTHHADPDIPWYKLPRRSVELESISESKKGAGYYSGYFEVFRCYLFKMHAHPVHPKEKVLS
tara:strand:+ start:171 stop:1076 length:906 start_codon:yes stop_codon:yes gene_type:complete